MNRATAEQATERGFLDAYYVASHLDEYEPRLKFIAKQHIQRYAYARRFVMGKRILDIACGTGYGCPVLLNSGAKSYTGIDVSTRAIDLAHKRFGQFDRVHFQAADAQKEDLFQPNSVDVAISFETIEHIKKYDQFLSSLHHALVPGGTLVISSPNRAVSNPSGSLRSKPNWEHHEQEWLLDEFKILLASHGFEVQAVRGQVFYAQRYRFVPGLFKLLRLVSARPIPLNPLQWIAEPNYFVIHAKKTS